MRPQEENGNGELYTPGHCSDCRDSEHGDYGDGSYTRISVQGTKGSKLVCQEHRFMNFEDNPIDAVVQHGPPKIMEIPERESDER